MLQSLHRKLVAIIMIMVGALIVALLAISVMNARSSFIEVVDRSLSQVLEQHKDDKTAIDAAPPLKDNNASTDNAQTSKAPSETQDDAISEDVALAGHELSSVGHMAIAWADIDTSGVLIDSNQDFVSIDADKLQAAIEAALCSDVDEGTIPDEHIWWRTAQTPSGLRIAIADTESMDQALSKQLMKAIIIGLSALVALFILANILAKWALRPVSKAWEQQHQFVADASHELKTPLAVILANTQILSEDAGNLPEQDRRWISSTSEEAQRMRGLVEDLLELARTEEGAGSARQNVIVDLSDVVEGQAMQFDAVAYEKGCAISTEVDPDLHVQGDPSQLERLTKTLVDNACKYAAQDSTIEVTLHKQNKELVLNVTNQGTPIDPEDLPHVFDRFYRSDKARTRDTGGYGLGLAIAKGICESHAGKISCTSSKAKGTCFSVRLPVSQK